MRSSIGPHFIVTVLLVSTCMIGKGPNRIKGNLVVRTCMIGKGPNRIKGNLVVRSERLMKAESPSLYLYENVEHWDKASGKERSAWGLECEY